MTRVFNFSAGPANGLVDVGSAAGASVLDGLRALGGVLSMRCLPRQA
jgi:hypothetical protein